MRTVITGRPLATPADPRHERWSTPVRLQAVRRHIAAGSLDAARAELDGLVAADPDSLRVHDLMLDVLELQGDLAAAVLEVRRARHLTTDRGIAPRVRRWLGELAVTDPSWLPRSAGLPGAAADPIPGRILDLVAPATADGASFATWTERSVQARLAAGLHPVVVTTLGSAGTGAGTHEDRTGSLASPTRYRLDLGAAYPLDGPADARLDDAMWLLTRIARRERPAVVQVASRLERPDEVLLGRALRAAFGFPLVVVVGPGRDLATDPDATAAPSLDEGERIAVRVRSTLARGLAAADALLAADEAGAIALRGFGIEPNRITVLPAAAAGEERAGDDLRALGRGYADAYERLTARAATA